MASYHWVAEKAIPYLMKDANMGLSKLQNESKDNYNVRIGYSTMWLGRQKAAEELCGTWKESFAYLYNFKAEVEQKMPRSVVEIDIIKDGYNVYFHKFFWGKLVL
jgi:hypothetical protein